MQSKPISVLHFSNEFERGGAEEHLLTLLRGLDRRRFQLRLVCTPAMAMALGDDLPEDVEVLPLCLRKPYHLGEAFRFARILCRKRVDILHSHMFYASFFASPIGRLTGVPVIIETPHVRERWRKGWLKSSYFPDRVAGKAVNHFVAVSKSNANYLISEKGLPREKVVIIRNGCDLRRFDPAKCAPEGLKAQLGFGQDDPVLLVLGRLEAQKGHSVLLRALPEAKRRVPNLKLVCAGNGGLKAELETLAHSLGLENSVRFVGFQSNVAHWLAMADATVLPSFYEGLPLAAIESLAAGRPVIASDVDGTPEVVVNGVTGLTFPPGDVAALASAICGLLTDPQWKAAMGRAGRQWVLKHFSHTQQVRETEALYLHALEKYRKWMALEGEENPMKSGVEAIESRNSADFRQFPRNTVHSPRFRA